MVMIDADDIWRGLDLLAEKLGTRVSNLSREAGLDPTALVNAKRHIGGKPRWPSTQTLARVLNSRSVTLREFAALVEGTDADTSIIPSVPITEAGIRDHWRTGAMHVMPHLNVGGASVPKLADDTAYALEVDSDNLFPFYRVGDILVASPKSEVNVGDRVAIIKEGVAATVGFAKRLGAREVVLYTLPDFDEEKFRISEILAVHKIAMQL